MSPANIQRFFVFFQVQLLFLFFQNYHTHAQTGELQRGKIIDTVSCLEQPPQTYALYLPSNYTKEKRWPVIYIFEPAARGSLPLKHFKEGAERYGYILVASNNAKNGPWEPIFESADALFLDTFKRFAIDANRVYTSGFSGGSRAALAVAVITKKVHGVIACGAGFPTVPSYRPTDADKFVYIGLVGDKDMNYSEHNATRQTLNDLGIENELLVFEGIHEWPPSKTVVKALSWLEVQNARRKGQKPDAALIKEMREMITKEAQNFEAEGHLLGAVEHYEFAARTLTAYSDISDMQKTIAKLKQDKSYAKLLKQKQKTEKKELQLKEKYLKAFSELHLTRLDTAAGQKDKTWWENEVRYLKRLSKGKDRQTHMMAERLLNLIWARCAESSFSYVQKADYEMALILNELWLNVQPESVWAYWSLAKLLALSGKPEKSIDALEMAVEHGLSKAASLEREPAFQLLSNEKRYTDLKRKLLSKAAN